MKISNKKALVTGAGGFIGSHLVEKLLHDGADVRAFVRYNSRSDFGMLEHINHDKYDNLEIISGDVRDYDAISQAMEDVDLVFHLAALVGIPYSYIHPYETMETNIIGTMNVLLAAKNAKTERVIHTSTSEIYGTAQYVPIDDKHPINPQSPYAATKIGADYLALTFHRSFGIPVSVIRPFNTYGPRQSSRAIIPTIIVQALTRPAITLGSLSPTRDFTYVTDTADAFVKAAISDEAIGQVINVGSNEEISIRDLAQLIQSLIGESKEVKLAENRKRPVNSEVERLRVDNRRAKELLGWVPKVTLKNGLSQTIKWIEKNIDRYKPDRYVV
jgi:NAD dependent epimerase/dehydratase